MKDYFDSLITSLEDIYKFDESIELTSSYISEKIQSGKGRVIIVSAGVIGSYVKRTVDSFEYLFKYDHSKIVTLKAGDKYRDMNIDDSRRLENVEAVGALDAIEMGINSDDLVISLSVTGSTKHLKYFLKESHDRGAKTVSITSSRQSGFKKEYIDLPIDVNVKNKTIKGLYIGNHTTILKIIIEFIMFESFKNLGQIVNGSIMTTNTWTKKLRDVSIEVLQVFDENITNGEALKLLENSEDELSIAILKLTRGLDNEQAKKLLIEHDYDFNKIGIY